jgi:hypothetical protein
MNLLFLLFFCLAIGAQSAPKGTAQFFANKTKIENPFKLRDPFKAPFMKSDGKRQGRGGSYTISGKGEYSNIAEIPTQILSPSNLRVVGVLIGKERRAMVSMGMGGKGSKIFVLKEGMKLGPEGAELKAILPGGIVLVEKMVNVYGEEEFLETVIPISK